MVWEENKVKLIGITINNELKFDSYILNICSKANKKFNFFYLELKIFQYFRSEGYSSSQFLKHSLKIALLYGYFVVDLPITKSASFTREL